MTDSSGDEGAWDRVKAMTRGPLTRLLESTRLVELSRDRAVLDPEARAMIEAKLDELGRLFQRATGRPIEVELTRIDATPAATDPEAPVAEAASDDLHIRVREHPLVKAAVEAFDAEIVDVRPRRKGD